MLAELLHMPDVSETVEVKAGNGLLNVKKRVDGGNLLLSVKMPVLLTVPFGCRANAPNPQDPEKGEPGRNPCSRRG